MEPRQLQELYLGVLRRLRSVHEPKLLRIRGRYLVLLPTVFDPTFYDSKLLAETVDSDEDSYERTLDVGTGSGIQAVVLAARSESVIAIDVYDQSLRNAYINCMLSQIEAKVSIQRSDLFKDVTGKFDLILFNPPFFPMKPRNNLEATIADENYRLLRRFLNEVPDYLTPKGEARMVTSDLIPNDLLGYLMTESQLFFEVISRGSDIDQNYTVYNLRRR